MKFLTRFAVKVPLEAPKTGAAKGCMKADVAVIEAIMKDPAGDDVNVHNAAYPKGRCAGSSPSRACAPTRWAAGAGA